MKEKYRIYSIHVGYRIRREREKKEISQTEMAKKLGISYTYYNNIERGSRSSPVEVLIEICRILGISSDRILCDYVPINTK